MTERRERCVGSLVGGAVGDALGAAVEFSSLSEIRQRTGPGGVRRYFEAYGHPAPITDDTQMTLFTAEGLLRAPAASDDARVTAVHRAYLRWLHTQQVRSEHVDFDDAISGWLVHEPVLHQRRAPGNTCIGGMVRAQAGAPGAPLNDSKGCGGVMRVAPVGLLVEDAFDLGCRVCALTHGHPSGWIAGGAFAELVALTLGGAPLREGVTAMRGSLTHPAGDEVRAAVDQALHAADTEPVSAETVESLGAGWVAEEALAIAIYCALVAEDFLHGVSLAVTHSGDSDSTGCIAGQLLGAHLGLPAIDGALLEPLEGRALVEQIAADLHDAAAGAVPSADRYPTDPPTLHRPPG
ncbi:MAG: ADP-ribosylglycohydrolase family protein [Myxococcota bacterium]